MPTCSYNHIYKTLTNILLSYLTPCVAELNEKQNVNFGIRDQHVILLEDKYCELFSLDVVIRKDEYEKCVIVFWNVKVKVKLSQ
jgi:hypothetical protein